ncbi:hypothetical protein [Synechococcus sp. PCC 7336]|uniref:hypothetical protein n=1 Tax=Synechococcus sp. PCC 7336 TaxID=195250 RepID=UPI00034A2852|nr:hypothetical protein [Synechococcus sp. PCC 7336]
MTETAVNQAPAITSQPIFVATPDTPYSYQVTAADPDAGILSPSSCWRDRREWRSIRPPDS